MSIPPFKFLQAGDFHLDRPPAGVAEVPEHLRATLVEASYRAATRVFDVALSERVDFLLLTGDLLHPPSAGPRGWFFLVEQFERLQHQGIKVYWTTGRDDAQLEWPALFPLPKNVWRFDRDGITRVVHERFGVPIAEICASGFAPRDKLRVADFRPEHEGLFSIAVAAGEIDGDLAAKHDGIDYWALGGEHQRHSVFTTPVVAHYAGSPQGRTPDETGPHGCTLVNVDELGQVETTFITTDVVRYQTERLTSIDTNSSEVLARVLSERAAALVGTGPDLLITWEIVGRGTAVRQLRRGAIEAELLAQLRAEWGRRQPAIYSLEVRAEPLGDVHESLFQEDSLRGEYLRLLKALDEATATTLDMREFLPERFLVGPVAAAVAVDSRELRETVLRDAALLGIDLLTGDAAKDAPILVPQNGRGEA
jgi:DNA repair exonuclease SbcCD nuclease subunit